jgi:hypothetical protein
MSEYLACGFPDSPSYPLNCNSKTEVKEVVE